MTLRIVFQGLGTSGACGPGASHAVGGAVASPHLPSTG